MNVILAKNITTSITINTGYTSEVCIKHTGVYILQCNKFPLYCTAQPIITSPISLYPISSSFRNFAFCILDFTGCLLAHKNFRSFGIVFVYLHSLYTHVFASVSIKMEAEMWLPKLPQFQTKKQENQKVWTDIALKTFQFTMHVLLVQ